MNASVVNHIDAGAGAGAAGAAAAAHETCLTHHPFETNSPTQTIAAQNNNCNSFLLATTKTTTTTTTITQCEQIAPAAPPFPSNQIADIGCCDRPSTPSSSPPATLCCESTDANNHNDIDHNDDNCGGGGGAGDDADHDDVERWNHNDNDNRGSTSPSTNLDLSTVITNENTTSSSVAAVTATTTVPTVPSAASAAAAAAPAPSDHRASVSSHRSGSHRRIKTVIRKFQKLDSSQLTSTPSPNVKIGQRVAYKEYYGNEFGTIRWIGRVPQISPDWTVGVEFDNAIGEGDGSLNGRRYFIAKDCFAKFLPLSAVALVDQHVGRPEPGTMISVMAAASQPGQMISIQRVSTVHVQHCFLNAPHHKPGADILAVNTRLHCQCPNCGPCAHVIKPPRTQRIAHAGKNATHMCQFSTYTCCGMESQEETMCTYTGNKVVSDPPPPSALMGGPPPFVGNSWIEGSGYLSNLQAQQRKLMPEEYILGAAPEDYGNSHLKNRSNRSSRRGSGKHHKNHRDDLDERPRSGSSAVDDSGSHMMQVSNELAPPTSQPQPETSKADVNQSEHYAVACLDKARSPESENGGRNLPKAAKVVYRNSIENRYLFPTDDPIDSALEEDLENLSQARYGYAPQSRLKSSGGLFKSLRSLVSCLNAPQSNQSDYEARSENTYRYSTRDMQAKNSSEPANNGAQPEVLYENTKYAQDMAPPPLYSSTSSSNNHQSEFRHDKVDHVIGRQISTSSDCGFSSASQNSINCMSHAAMSQASPIEDHIKSQQIYRRIVARLMNNSAITDNDLEKLKTIFIGSPFEGCCLHNQANFSTAEIDQTIADIAQRTLIHGDKDYGGMESSITACYHANTQCCRAQIGTDAIQTNGSDIFFANKSVTNRTPTPNCCIHRQPCVNEARKHGEGSVASDSITLSSYESSSNAVACDQQTGSVKSEVLRDSSNRIDEKNSEKSNLPKAFELKLTLSINSDGKQSLVSACDEQSNSGIKCKMEGKDCSSSVLDIEIKSPDDQGSD